MPVSSTHFTSLDAHLSHHPYACGYTPSAVDHRLVDVVQPVLPHIARWHAHVSSFALESRQRFETTVHATSARRWPIAQQPLPSVVQALLDVMTAHVEEGGDAASKGARPTVILQ